jgi:hypothetical protein
MMKLDEPMNEPMDNSGGSAARPRPWSLVRGTPTPVPLPPEAPSFPNEVIPSPSEPIPTELLHLWTLLTQREPWSSLVVVPAQPGASGLDTARALVSVGSQYRERPIRLIDAQGLPPGAASRLVKDIRAYVEQGGMIITCIDSVITNPVGLQVALASERALLCVPLGSTQFSAAKQTLEMIGKSRFLGSVTLQPQGRGRK